MKATLKKGRDFEQRDTFAIVDVDDQLFETDLEETIHIEEAIKEFNKQSEFEFFDGFVIETYDCYWNPLELPDPHYIIEVIER